MRKLALVFIVILAISASAWAQEGAQSVKKPTIDELQWKALYLQERLKSLQADYQITGDTLKQVQAEIKAMQPATTTKAPETPQPKPPEAPKPKDEKGKK